MNDMKLATRDQIEQNKAMALDGVDTSVGQFHDMAAAAMALLEYKQDKRPNTLDRQERDLDSFAEYLSFQGGYDYKPDLFNNPFHWAGVTWGLVNTYIKKYLFEDGFAVSTINGRLSTIKIYAGLAAKVGAVGKETSLMISSIKGYKAINTDTINQNRANMDLPTRQGSKKAANIELNSLDIAALKENHPETPIGKRDRFIITLGLDYGLRCGEMASLRASDLDVQSGRLRFYRHKIKKAQTIILEGETLQAAREYYEACELGRDDYMFVKFNYSGRGNNKMSERGLTRRVQLAGNKLGLDNLSMHDLRHAAATTQARAGVPLKDMLELMGWSSPSMALRYIDDNKEIRNKAIIGGTI